MYLLNLNNINKKFQVIKTKNKQKLLKKFKA